MDVYLVHERYGEPPLVFSSLKLAEEKLLENIRRNKYSTGFSLSIHRRNLDYSGMSEFKYSGNVRIVGNLKFIEIDILNNIQGYKEVLIRYIMGNEIDLIDTQLDSISPSNPEYLYFNDKECLDGFKYAFINKGLVYSKKLIEDETREWIKDYFKYKIYLSSYKQNGEEEE